MKKVVCDDGRRPQLYEKWRHDRVADAVSRKMQECWFGNPSARPSALTVKVFLLELLEKEEGGPTLGFASLNNRRGPMMALSPSATASTTSGAVVSRTGGGGGGNAATTPARRSGVSLGVAGVMYHHQNHHQNMLNGSTSSGFIGGGEGGGLDDSRQQLT